MTCVFSGPALAATSSGESWLSLLSQRQLNGRTVSTAALSVPRINPVPKHPKILALLHYNKPPTCEPSGCKLSMSGLSENAACPPSPIADDPSALPSPTASPSSSQQLFLPLHLTLASVCQLLYCTTGLFNIV